jgi:hypothetical protein
MVYSGVAGTAGIEQPAAPAATSKKPGLTHRIPDTPLELEQTSNLKLPTELRVFNFNSQLSTFEL